VLAPETVHRYRCPCGDVVLEVAGPSWLAWDLAAARAMEHAKTCPMARERWHFSMDDTARS
jgi:hypothetical protein